jgi:hypothetical protein
VHLQPFSDIFNDKDISASEDEEEGAILTFVQFEENNDIWGSLLPMLVREAHEGVR